MLSDNLKSQVKSVVLSRVCKNGNFWLHMPALPTCHLSSNAVAFSITLSRFATRESTKFKMAGERTNLLLHGLGTLIIATATITLMVSVFTDNWIQSPVEGSGFQKAGLWKICLVNYVIHRNVQSPKGLVGCYSFVDPIFYDVQDWIHPSKYKTKYFII